MDLLVFGAACFVIGCILTTLLFSEGEPPDDQDEHHSDDEGPDGHS